MTEQGPRPIDLTPIESGLTVQPNPHRLNMRGDIFMPREPGAGDMPPIRPTEGPAPASPPGRGAESEPSAAAPIEGESVDTAPGPESPGATTDMRDPLSAVASSISEDLTGEEKDFIIKTRGDEAEDVIRKATEQRRELKRYADAFMHARGEERLNPETAYHQLNEAIKRGEVSITEAQALFDAIVETARQSGRYASEETPEIDEILKITSEPERRLALMGWIGEINPDSEQFTAKQLRAVAGDPEAAEMFLDKIISKPFAAPEDQYSLSFYAGINLSGFLTEVNTVSRQRHTEYVRKKETSLRFHEMNRTIISESGNLEAFFSISRSVAPQHLQTATEMTGAAHMRHLIESAFKRLYAAKNQVEEHDFPEQIIERSIRQFYKDAGYKFVVTPGENDGKWVYEGREVLKSKYRGAGGKQRHLEVWEIERAIAFGRNIHAAFYRSSELISWSHVPSEVQEWLKSMPSETVVRNLAGLKMLHVRFRYAITKGGPQFAALLYDKVQAGFRKKVNDYNKKYEKEKEKNRGNANYKDKGRMITKIGKLDAAEDLIPSGFFKASGFDKGWRTLAAYFDIKVANIIIPDSSIFPDLTEKDFSELNPKNFTDPEIKPADVPGIVRDKIRKFIDTNGGNETTLYRFLIKQELAYQLATAVSDKEATAAGVLTPRDQRPFNSDIQKTLVEQALMPLLGYKYNPKGARERAEQQNPPKANWIGPWEYKGDTSGADRLADQINLSLGILIANGSSSEIVKTALWKKAASFLPLEVAYFLSEGGVKSIPGYENFKGEGKFLFNDEFEDKLFRAEQSRVRAQVQEQERAAGAEAKAERIAKRIDLDSFLEEAGIVDADEIAFVKALQEFGEGKAEQLAIISFPQIPILEDVPFDKADYISLGAEVFPRRIGRDFSGYAKATEEGGNIIGHLELPYEEILKTLGHVEDSLSGPEGTDAAQDVGLVFLKTYFEMAKQWTITRFPLARPLLEFIGNPTSEFQKIFGRNAPSWGAAEMNSKANDALSKGLFRRVKIPGKNQSQMNELLRHAGATWVNVLEEQGPKGLVFLIMTMLFKFFKEATSSK